MAADVTSQLPAWKEVEKYPEGNICLQESSPGGHLAVTGGVPRFQPRRSARLLRVFQSGCFNPDVLIRGI